MSTMKLCVFASTPDMAALDFVVRVLTGTPHEIARRAIDWGYDGLEFMPDPELIPDPLTFEEALGATGAVMPVINTGRMYPQGLSLLHADPTTRARALRAFKNIVSFAGHFKAKVGMGIARGTKIPGATAQDMDAMADDVFRELTEHAEKAGAVIMLEPIHPGAMAYIETVAEAMAWIDRISSPAFTVMLDTYQLARGEPSIEHGIRTARGMATHIHFYDPSRWPPGVLSECQRLDWTHIGRTLRTEGFQGTGSVALAPEGDAEPAARKASMLLRRLLCEDGGLAANTASENNLKPIADARNPVRKCRHKDGTLYGLS